MIVEETYVDVAKLTVRQINKSVADSFVRTHHYTKRMSSARYTLGLFYRHDQEHNFFAGTHETLIGCIVYGHPVSNATVTSIFKTIQLPLSGILELTRLVVLDGHGKNIESWFIGQSFKWIKTNDKTVKVLVSYADPEQGHTGTIYRATNWLYQGCGAGKLMPDFSIKLFEDGDWIHSRTVGSMFGSRNVDSLAQKIGHTFYRKADSSKHRYLQFICSPSERKRYLADIKIPVIPYNQVSPFTLLIQRVNVQEGKVTSIEVLQGKDIGWKINRDDNGQIKETED